MAAGQQGVAGNELSKYQACEVHFIGSVPGNVDLRDDRTCSIPRAELKKSVDDDAFLSFMRLSRQSATTHANVSECLY